MSERGEALLREILDSPDVLMTPQLRKIARREAKELKTASGEEVLELCNFLVEYGGSGRVRREEHGPAYESRMVAFDLAWMHKAAFALLDWRELERLGRTLDGWASVDHFARKLSGPAWQRGPDHRRPHSQVGDILRLLVAPRRPGLNDRLERTSSGQRRRWKDVGHLRALRGRPRGSAREGLELGVARVGNPRSRRGDRVHHRSRSSLGSKNPARSPQQAGDRPQASQTIRGDAASDARASVQQQLNARRVVGEAQLEVPQYVAPEK